MPDREVVLKTTSSNSRLASLFHEFDGIARRNMPGFFASSLMRAAKSETANVRMMRKIKENQK